MLKINGRHFLLLTIALALLIVSCSKNDYESDESIIKSAKQDIKDIDNNAMFPPKFQKYTGYKDPVKGSVEIDPKMPPPPPCLSGGCELWDTLVFNGPNKINVVFVSEGFTVFEIHDFNNLVDDLVNNVFGPNGIEPYKIAAPSFNFFMYRTQSIQSGVSVKTHVSNPVPEVIVDTYWDAYSNAIGLDRLVTIPHIKRLQLKGALNDPFWGYLPGKIVYPVIIANTGMYGGSGDFIGAHDSGFIRNNMSVTTITKDTEYGYFHELFAHEFGHAFGDLDDEYQDSDPPQPGEYAYHGPLYDQLFWNYPPRANIAQNDGSINSIWQNFNRYDGIFGYDVGHFEGARYLQTGLWRSTEFSMMAEINQPFSELQQYLILKRVKKMTGDGYIYFD